MKLLLINPYFGEGESSATEGAAHHPPLGLGFVGTYIKKHSNCIVEIVDPVAQNLKEEDVLAKVKDAEFIGLSCFTDTRFYCFNLAKKIKQTNPHCLLMVGGAHVYSLYKLILQYYPFIDVLVRGEGEETVLDIINKKPLEEIQGITWKNTKGEIIRNTDRPFIKNIDDLYIDYSLFPDMNRYKPDIEVPIDLRRLKTAFMIESRGCPYQCTFCANDHWKRTWRSVSPHKIVEKMENMINTYGIEYFRFYDDLFTANKKHVFDFCEEITRRKLKTNFRILIRAGTKKEVLEALKDVGCESVGFGIESGSDRILKRIKKEITVKQVIDTINICKELNLWTVGAFMVSLPDETDNDFRETLKITKLLDTFQTNILHLFPNTPLYNELKEKGEIDDTIWFDEKHKGLIYYCKENFHSANFSFRDAEWKLLYTKYYHIMNNPRKVFRQYGYLVGLLVLVTAIIDIPLRGKIYRTAFRYRNVYRRLMMG